MNTLQNPLAKITLLGQPLVKGTVNRANAVVLDCIFDSLWTLGLCEAEAIEQNGGQFYRPTNQPQSEFFEQLSNEICLSRPLSRVEEANNPKTVLLRHPLNFKNLIAISRDFPYEHS